MSWRRTSPRFAIAALEQLGLTPEDLTPRNSTTSESPGPSLVKTQQQDETRTASKGKVSRSGVTEFKAASSHNDRAQSSRTALTSISTSASSSSQSSSSQSTASSGSKSKAKLTPEQPFQVNSPSTRTRAAARTSSESSSTAGTPGPAPSSSTSSPVTTPTTTPGGASVVGTPGVIGTPGFRIRTRADLEALARAEDQAIKSAMSDGRLVTTYFLSQNALLVIPQEKLDDRTFLERHKQYEESERTHRRQASRQVTRWIICDGCRKWRILSRPWNHKVFYCGYHLSRKAPDCAKPDDWLLKALQGDVEAVKKLASVGVHTVEGLADQPAKIDALRKIGFHYDPDTQRVTRYFDTEDEAERKGDIKIGIDDFTEGEGSFESDRSRSRARSRSRTRRRKKRGRPRLHKKKRPRGRPRGRPRTKSTGRPRGRPRKVREEPGSSASDTETGSVRSETSTTSRSIRSPEASSRSRSRSQTRSRSRTRSRPRPRGRPRLKSKSRTRTRTEPRSRSRTKSRARARAAQRTSGTRAGSDSEYDAESDESFTSYESDSDSESSDT